MEKIFASPSRYIQGKDVLKTGLSHIAELGNKALLLSDDIVWKLVGEELKGNLEAEGIAVVHVPFNGEASVNEITRVTAIGTENGVDVVIALGGGKTIDSGKAI